MPQYTKVASGGDITPGSAKLLEINGKRIALFNVDGIYYAIDDTCTHRGGPLSEGMVEGEEVECPWHGARFNLNTGVVLGGPAPKDVACYNVRVQGDDVEIEV